MHKKIVLLVFSVFLFTGCTPTVNYEHTKEVYSRIFDGQYTWPYRNIKALGTNDDVIDFFSMPSPAIFLEPQLLNFKIHNNKTKTFYSGKVIGQPCRLNYMGKERSSREPAELQSENDVYSDQYIFPEIGNYYYKITYYPEGKAQTVSFYFIVSAYAGADIGFSYQLPPQPWPKVVIK